MKTSTLTVGITLSLSVLAMLFNCKSDDDMKDSIDQECYRCTHMQGLQTSCDSVYVFEACVIRPHENSLQVVLEIIEICNGQVRDTTEAIRFVEGFLAEQQNAGANCEGF